MFVVPVVNVGCDPPQDLALFVVGQEIGDIRELKNGVGRPEKLLAFIKKGRHKKGIPVVEPERKADKGIQILAGLSLLYENLRHRPSLIPLTLLLSPAAGERAGEGAS
jgi:hypothetical protein